MRSSTFKKAAIGAALAVAYASGASAAITAPGGFGESFMHFTNFQFRIGDGAPGLSPLGPLGAAGTSGTETSTASAFLNGAGVAGSGCGVTNLGVGYSCLATIGSGFAPGGALVPQTGDPLSPTGAGSGGLSSSVGDSRTGLAEVYLHSLSQLSVGGQTNASSTQDLNAVFSIPSAAGAIPVELTFDMERFIRAGLGQDSRSANATSVFNVTIKRNNIPIFLWQPTGDTTSDLIICNVAITCLSHSDPFALSSNLTVDNEIADRTAGADGSEINYAGGGTQSGFFEVEVVLPGGFDYTVEINGRVTSSTRIPEPGTVALLGLGLLGLGAVARRSRKA